MCLHLLFGEVLAQRIGAFSTGSIFQHNTLYFTASTRLPDQNEGMLGYSFLSGPYRNIRTFYLSGVGQLSKEDDQHMLGVNVLRYERGELISESSIKVVYRIAIPLNEKVELLTGTHLGIYQLNLEASSTTASANDFKFNIDWSLGLKTPKVDVGIYVNNLTEPQLMMTEESVKYKRTFGGYWVSPLYENAKLHSMLALHATYLFGNTDVVLSFDQLVYDKMSFGVNLGNRRVSFYGGLRNIEFRQSKMDVQVGYQFPVAMDVSTVYSPLELLVRIR